MDSFFFFYRGRTNKQKNIRIKHFYRKPSPPQIRIVQHFCFDFASYLTKSSCNHSRTFPYRHPQQKLLDNETTKIMLSSFSHDSLVAAPWETRQNMVLHLSLLSNLNQLASQLCIRSLSQIHRRVGRSVGRHV